MAKKSSSRALLEALLDEFEPEIRDAFLASIQDITSNVILERMIRAITNGDVEEAFRALGYSVAAMRPLTNMIERAYERGGVLTGNTFPKFLNTTSGRGVYRFDVRNSRAEAALRDRSSGLVTRIGDEIRVVLRNTLTEGMERGDNPRTTALDIIGRKDMNGKRSGGFIGLTEQQERWVSNTRRKLETLDPTYFDRELRDERFDRTVMKAIRDEKPLDKETIIKLTDAYKNNALKYRGDSIARTESMWALNSSEFEAVKQARDLGAINESATKREWDSAGDSRVRYSHKKMDGQTVGIDEPFKTPSGALLMFPGDSSMGAGGEEIIMCRCRARLKVDWLAGFEDA